MKTKRLLSALLAAAMLLTLLPANTAFAQSWDTDETITDVLTLTEGSTIAAGTKLTLQSLDGDFKINGNGYTLTNNGTIEFVAAENSHRLLFEDIVLVNHGVVSAKDGDGNPVTIEIGSSGHIINFGTMTCDEIVQTDETPTLYEMVLAEPLKMFLYDFDETGMTARYGEEITLLKSSAEPNTFTAELPYETKNIVFRATVKSPGVSAYTSQGAIMAWDGVHVTRDSPSIETNGQQGTVSLSLFVPQEKLPDDFGSEPANTYTVHFTRKLSANASLVVDNTKLVENGAVTANTIPNASYDELTNTFTLDGYNNAASILARDMGDFTVAAKGMNKVHTIDVGDSGFIVDGDTSLTFCLEKGSSTEILSRAAGVSVVSFSIEGGGELLIQGTQHAINCNSLDLSGLDADSVVTASTNYDGSGAGAYDAAKLYYYKYFKVTPSYVGNWLDKDGDTYKYCDFSPFAEATATTYTISTPAQLAGLAAKVNDGNNFSGKTIMLEGDLDMSAHLWTPIGWDGKFFSGSFLGNGKTISKMKIDMAVSSDEAVGLFGYISGGIVDGLTLSVFSIKTTDKCRMAGGIACLIENAAVRNCLVRNGEVLIDYSENNACLAGGIAGADSTTDSTISNCAVVNTSLYVKNNSGVSIGGICAHLADGDNLYVSGNSLSGDAAGVFKDDFAPTIINSLTNTYVIADDAEVPAVLKKLNRGAEDKLNEYNVWAVDASVNGGLPYLTGEKYKVSVTPDDKDFGEKLTGYASVLPQEFTITTNEEIQYLNINMVNSGNSNFEITKDVLKSIYAAGKTANFSVTPKTSLPAGTYTEDICITSSNMPTLYRTVTFKVRDPYVYIVTFDPNGGEGDLIRNPVTEPATTIELPSTNLPTKEGFKLSGWYTKNGENGDYGTEFTAATTVSGNITVFARWIEKRAVTPDESTQNYDYDETAKAFVISGVSETGFAVSYFVNNLWTATAPINAGMYDVKITRTEDDTYKKYETTLTGGLVIKQATPTVAALPTAARIKQGNKLSASVLDGGIINGIDANPIDGTFTWKTPDQIMNNTGDFAETVVFTPRDENYAALETDVSVNVYRTSGGGGTTRYTAKFEANGGTAVSSQSVTRNSVIKEPTAPTKEGCIFDGWYTDKDLTEKYDFPAKVTKAFTLYAKWSEDNSNKIIFTIGEKDVLLFGKTVENDVAPMIRNDRTMLPARFVAEALGAEVLWDETSPGIVTITRDDIVIVIRIGEEYATVNGKQTELDSPAFIENDRTYTPLRFVVENLGATVDWNEATNQVTIVTK